jgi:hypothetical protein
LELENPTGVKTDAISVFGFVARQEMAIVEDLTSERGDFIRNNENG